MYRTLTLKTALSRDEVERRLLACVEGPDGFWAEVGARFHGRVPRYAATSVSHYTFDLEQIMPGPEDPIVYIRGAYVPTETGTNVRLRVWLNPAAVIVAVSAVVMSGGVLVMAARSGQLSWGLFLPLLFLGFLGIMIPRAILWLKGDDVAAFLRKALSTPPPLPS